MVHAQVSGKLTMWFARIYKRGMLDFVVCWHVTFVYPNDRSVSPLTARVTTSCPAFLAQLTHSVAVLYLSHFVVNC